MPYGVAKFENISLYNVLLLLVLGIEILILFILGPLTKEMFMPLGLSKIKLIMLDGTVISGFIHLSL